ncbi:hypothetical protein EPI10_028102 [Gossypium australe]|uniref:Uncharacterized protein n=1 Tax=Gossypium australe TaxID=47621 RepID=A0A5B6UUX9_9ROSI|nr:hypothetical protein EPI10_028102 [Gossypium australe]
MGILGRRGSGGHIDPVLGLNLEEDLQHRSGQMDTEHDLEDCPIENGKRKKRPQKECRSLSESLVNESLGNIARRLMDRDHLLSAAAKKQADRS